MIIFIYLSKFEYLVYLSSFYIMILSTIGILNYFNLKSNLSKFNLKSMAIKIQTIAFLSSFSIVISSFVWRIVIYFLFDKSLSGYFLLAFQLVHLRALYLIQ